jgi:hypothetical protein
MKRKKQSNTLPMSDRKKDVLARRKYAKKHGVAPIRDPSGHLRYPPAPVGKT